VIQVLTLYPYRVVRHRGTTPEQRSIRLDNRWMFFPIADDEIGTDTELVFSACRCTGLHQFTLRAILGRQGDNSTVRPPPHPLTKRRGTSCTWV
jgi:hypothetical protein